MKNLVWVVLLTMQSVVGAWADHDSMVSVLSSNVVASSHEHEQQHVLQRPDHNQFAEDVDSIKDYNEAAAAPQDPQILISADDTGFSTVPTNLDVHEASLDGMSLGKALELAEAKAIELDLPQVASDIGIWVQHHPWKAAFYAGSALAFFAPEILSLPALEALGFGITGSVIGPVAARSVFAIWQSARMGGYGVEYVNGGVRALVALTDAAVAACNPLKDCKGLISDGGQRLLGGSSATIALSIVCGWLVGLNILRE
ncbi:MAG: hypothetical protein Q9171_007176 [Xanthocarpia ochracea]